MKKVRDRGALWQKAHQASKLTRLFLINEYIRHCSGASSKCIERMPESWLYRWRGIMRNITHNGSESSRPARIDWRKNRIGLYTGIYCIAVLIIIFIILWLVQLWYTAFSGENAIYGGEFKSVVSIK